MSEERYVDPNSGAAPQPGGWVGPEGADKGFAGVASTEPEPSKYEAPGSDGKDTNGVKGFGKGGNHELGTEELAVAHKALETEGRVVSKKVLKTTADDVPDGNFGGVRKDDPNPEPEPDSDDSEDSEESGAGSSDEEKAAEEKAKAEQEAADRKAAEEAKEKAAAEKAAADEKEQDELYAELLSKPVPEVRKYIEENPGEKDAVVAAESRGQKRQGIVNA